MVFEESLPVPEQDKENIENSKWKFSTPSKANPNYLKPHEYQSVEKKSGAFITPSPTKKNINNELAYYDSKLNNAQIDIPDIIKTDIVKLTSIKQVKVVTV